MNRSAPGHWVVILVVSTLLNVVLTYWLLAKKSNPETSGSRTPASVFRSQNPAAVIHEADPVPPADAVPQSPKVEESLRANLLNFKGRFLALDRDLKLSKAFAAAFGLDSNGASRMEALFKKLYSGQMATEKKLAQIKNEPDGDSYYQIPRYDGALESEVAELITAMTELAGPASTRDLQALLRVDYRHGGMFYDQEISLAIEDAMLPNIRMYWKDPAGADNYWMEDIVVHPLRPNEKYSHRVVDRFSHIIDFQALLKPHAHRTNP